ncbi:MAG: SMP-30/gluconolactonase/LRE family protein [Pseudomonadota bacterium]
MNVFDDHPCVLGEGPLWHPERKALFWFDIMARRLHCKAPGAARQTWTFDDHVSAAGWVDRDTLLMASATGLWRFDIPSGARDLVVPLEADDPVTRSNDGRADPQGGFWIGTMGVNLEPKAGAIYRYYKGELRQLYPEISIPNSICFAPDGRTAYFADTPQQQIMKVALDDDGWPDGAPQVFVDLRADDLNPDGSVVDARGVLWNAQWGAGRLAMYSPDGTLTGTLDVPATQPTCPAFGGTTVYVTTAAGGLDAAGAGLTYAIDAGVEGQQEHRVIL